MAKLEEHRPTVAQPLHNAAKDAHANVPEPETSAPAETSRLPAMN
jgi:hypothetical protein